MSKKSVVKNYIYNLAYQVLAVVLPLVTTPYLSRVLGAENIGIYSFTLSIVTYFILVGSLGVGLYGQKEIAYTQDDKERRSRKFWEIFCMRCVTMTVSMAVFYVTFCLGGEHEMYYKILLCQMVANVFDISWFFQGMEEFKKTVLRNMAVRILGLVLTFCFVRTSADLAAYFWIYVLTNLVGNLSLWTYLPKLVSVVKLKSLKTWSHLKPCAFLFIPQVAVQVYTVLDKTMIGAMVPDIAEVAYYEQSQKITKVLLSIVTAFGAVMLPRISAYFSRKEHEKIQEALGKSFNFALLLSVPIMFGLMAVADSLIPWFLGPGFDKAIIILKVIAPIVVLIALSNAIGMQYMLPVKEEKKYTICVVMGAVVNFVGNLILIRMFNSVGAAVATDLAELVVTGGMMIATRKDFDYRKILKMGMRYVLYGGVMWGACMVVRGIMGVSVACMVTQMLTGVLVYGLCLVLTRDRLVFDAVRKIKERVLLVFRRRR